jgi:chromosome segregation ATPase
MSQQLSELENLLRQLVGEHDKLLKQLEAQQAAMKKLDLKAMAEVCDQQEAVRMRIAALETRRRLLVQQLAAALRIPQPATIMKLAEASPQARSRLLELRSQLKASMEQISARAQIAGKVAGAVLGHLNTAVRLLAGAVEQAGLYTKQGVPQVSGRIGVMEAVA